MKMKLHYAGTAVLGAVLCAMLGACSDEVPAIDKNEAYTREFIKKYGVPDAGSDWNAAARAEATVQGTMPAGAAYVQVFTADPMSPGAMLAAEYPAAKSTFKFDFAKKADKAYVRILDARRSVLAADYVDMKANTLAINANALVGQEDCPVTVGDHIRDIDGGKHVVSLDFNVFFDQNNNVNHDLQREALDLWREILGDRYDEVVQDGKGKLNATDVFNTYVLDNKVTEPTARLNTSMVLDLMNSTDGVFREQHCNMTHYRELLHPEEGLGYVTAEDGPVTLSYFYGCTMFYNKLGYLYFPENATIQEIMAAPRFVLIDNGRPEVNVKVGNSDDNMYELQGGGGEYAMTANSYLYGTKHQLVYFGEGTEFEKGAKGSYIFPKGTRIVLFIIKGGNCGSVDNIEKWKRSYSYPTLNKIMGYVVNHNPTESGKCEETRQRPCEDFCTFDWMGNHVIGVEDGVGGGGYDGGSDHDLNDMMFFFRGNFGNETYEMHEDYRPQSWIVAVEDLGNTDDFDFNDIVFRVSHVSGTTEATVELLAAGGTLPANIYLKDIAEAIGTSKGYLHINEFFGESDHSVMINTTALDHTYGKVTIQVDPEFSMAETIETMKTNMGGFFVKVNPNDNTDWVDGVYEIHPKDDGEFSVPQMICIPDSWTDDAGNTVRWCWPAERISIESAYPRFRDWVKKAEGNEDWYKTVNENLVIKRTK